MAQASDTNFVLTQLISMCTLFDLGDEAGRRKLLQVLLQLLHMFALAQPAQYVAPAMASLRYLFHDDKAEYHKTMVFAVARLRSAGNWTGDGQQPDAELDLAHVELHMEEQNRRRVQKQQRLQELRKAEEDAAEGPELLELQEEVKVPASTSTSTSTCTPTSAFTSSSTCTPSSSSSSSCTSSSTSSSVFASTSISTSTSISVFASTSISTSTSISVFASTSSSTSSSTSRSTSIFVFASTSSSSATSSSSSASSSSSHLYFCLCLYLYL